jgi:FixJ family two-component response regulator
MRIMSSLDTTIFIVDDDPAILDALSLMLEQENLTVKTFESAEDFLKHYQAERKGCAIIDVRMPEMDGMELQEILLKQNMLLPIIFLTGHGNIPMSVKAIKSGATDFLTKPVRREKLLAAINVAVRESERLLTENTHHEESLTRLAELTERERDVMMLAVQGLANKHIARELGISHRTVEIHKSKIMHKTGAENLLDLARIVHESGLS